MLLSCNNQDLTPASLIAKVNCVLLPLSLRYEIKLNNYSSSMIKKIEPFLLLSCCSICKQACLCMHI